MAISEGDLVQQARAGLNANREAREEYTRDHAVQQQADQVSVATRHELENLLLSKGTLLEDSGSRKTFATLAVIPVVNLAVAFDETMTYLEQRKTPEGYLAPWKRNDYRLWEGLLNDGEPQVHVQVRAMGHPNPIKARHVDVRLSGLLEFMRYSRSYGELYQEQFGRHNFIRRANMQDAQRWQQFVGDLRRV